MNFFVTAIGTNSGKTLASAILVQALEADYWKPVQSGNPADTAVVKALVANTKSTFHAEKWVFGEPIAPHIAAAHEGVRMDLHDIRLPETENHLVVEGAGGLMVPLNEKDVMADIAQYLSLQIVLVSNNYLGSINHTLLTLSELARRDVRIKGIIFNGEPSPEAEEFILEYSGLPCLLRILPEPAINQEVVSRYAAQLSPHLI